MNAKVGHSTLNPTLLASLTDLDARWHTIQRLAPDLISVPFGPTDSLPIAVVPLYEAIDTLKDAEYALRQAYRHHSVKSQHCSDTARRRQNHVAKFYCDDATLRLCSCAEHLFGAIKRMFSITDHQLKPYRGNTKISALVIARYLTQENPRHYLTSEARKLANSQQLKSIWCYRNNWVHNQPFLIKDIGWHWKRGSRWKASKSTASARRFRLVLGTQGDRPKYTLDQLLDLLSASAYQISHFMCIVVDFYIRELGRFGISVSLNQISVQG